MEITDFEKAMLNTINEHYPNSWEDIFRAWELTEHFDDCIKILEYSNANLLSIDDSAYNLFEI